MEPQNEIEIREGVGGQLIASLAVDKRHGVQSAEVAALAALESLEKSLGLKDRLNLNIIRS